MARYYVNRNTQRYTGDHEVHVETCPWMPDADDRSYLGDFDTCRRAVQEAQKHFRQANGCYYCSIRCHSG